MLVEFQPDGMFYKYISEDEQGFQTINFIGFTHFINCYFGAELPVDLIQQLFLSFTPIQHNAMIPASSTVTTTLTSQSGQTSLDGTSIASSFASSFSQTSSNVNGSTIAPPHRPGIFQMFFVYCLIFFRTKVIII